MAAVTAALGTPSSMSTANASGQPPRHDVHATWQLRVPPRRTQAFAVRLWPAAPSHRSDDEHTRPPTARTATDPTRRRSAGWISVSVSDRTRARPADRALLGTL